MAILGPYSGDPQLSGSYLYGEHWKGFKVIQGESDYNHRFVGCLVHHFMHRIQ